MLDSNLLVIFADKHVSRKYIGIFQSRNITSAILKCWENRDSRSKKKKCRLCFLTERLLSLRWRNWRLKYVGVQDRALKSCPGYTFSYWNFLVCLILWNDELTRSVNPMIRWFHLLADRYFEYYLALWQGLHVNSLALFFTDWLLLSILYYGFHRCWNGISHADQRPSVGTSKVIHCREKKK